MGVPTEIREEKCSLSDSGPPPSLILLGQLKNFFLRLPLHNSATICICSDRSPNHKQNIFKSYFHRLKVSRRKRCLFLPPPAPGGVRPCPSASGSFAPAVGLNLDCGNLILISELRQLRATLSLIYDTASRTKTSL